MSIGFTFLLLGIMLKLFLVKIIIDLGESDPHKAMILLMQKYDIKQLMTIQNISMISTFLIPFSLFLMYMN